MQQFTPNFHTAAHPLTGLDARVKLLSALMMLVMVTSCRGFLFPLLVAALSFGLCLAVGARPRVLAIRFAEPLFLVVMVIILKLFFSGHEPLFSINLFGREMVGHLDGLLEGLLIAARIGGAVTLVALLGFSTPFTEMMAALAWLRVPRGFIEVALFAWRYLFVLFEDAMVVYHAQRNRLGYAGYRRGIRSFGTLAGVMVIKAFDNSQTITTAMVQRGYDGTMPLIRQKPFRVAEVSMALLVVALMGAIWRI